ncbi:hypothetical protein MRX96_056966 [Rhipicephalus microplus]
MPVREQDRSILKATQTTATLNGAFVSVGPAVWRQYGTHVTKTPEAGERAAGAAPLSPFKVGERCLSDECQSGSCSVCRLIWQCDGTVRLSDVEVAEKEKPAEALQRCAIRRPASILTFRSGLMTPPLETASSRLGRGTGNTGSSSRQAVWRQSQRFSAKPFTFRQWTLLGNSGSP